MEVILREEIEKLGHVGSIVKVATGRGIPASHASSTRKIGAILRMGGDDTGGRTVRQRMSNGAARTVVILRYSEGPLVRCATVYRTSATVNCEQVLSPDRRKHDERTCSQSTVADVQ